MAQATAFDAEALNNPLEAQLLALGGRVNG
jgi:hypothetical protein